MMEFRRLREKHTTLALVFALRRAWKRDQVAIAHVNLLSCTEWMPCLELVFEEQLIDFVQWYAGLQLK